MCELFGFCGNTRVQLNDLLEVFFSHSTQHPHGWGIAIPEGNHVLIEKEPVRAVDSRYLRERLRGPIIPSTLLAHIRYATVGFIERVNCQPYTGTDCSGRRWTLIHNGTIFDFPELNKYTEFQEGSSDSERVLLYFIDLINTRAEKGSYPEADERFRIFDRSIPSLARGNKLNFILFDGDLFYVHKNAEGTMVRKETPNGTFFATKPLDDGAWEDVPMTTLLAYRNGELVYTGRDHGNIYIEDPEKVRSLYSVFSAL